MRHQPSRQVLERAYNEEKDADTRSRILLVLRVRIDGERAVQASKGLHRTRAWATKWLKRFEKNGLDGLRTAERSGRPPKIPRSTLLRVRRKVERSKDAWRVKEVNELIQKESSVTFSLRQVYRILHRWGFRPVVPRKRFVNRASKEETQVFKKRRGGS